MFSLLPGVSLFDPLLLGDRLIEMIPFSFGLVRSPHLVADALNAYRPVGDYANRFLEPTIHAVVVVKRRGVEIDRLRRNRAGGGHRPRYHVEFFS